MPRLLDTEVLTHGANTLEVATVTATMDPRGLKSPEADLDRVSNTATSGDGVPPPRLGVGSEAALGVSAQLIQSLCSVPLNVMHEAAQGPGESPKVDSPYGSHSDFF